MARIIDAKGCIILGTPQQICELIGLLHGPDAAVVDLKEAKLVPTATPISQADVDKALQNLLAEKAAKIKPQRTRRTQRTTKK